MRARDGNKHCKQCDGVMKSEFVPPIFTHTKHRCKNCGAVERTK